MTAATQAGARARVSRAVQVVPPVDGRGLIAHVARVERLPVDGLLGRAPVHHRPTLARSRCGGRDVSIAHGGGGGRLARDQPRGRGGRPAVDSRARRRPARHHHGVGLLGRGELGRLDDTPRVEHLVERRRVRRGGLRALLEQALDGADARLRGGGRACAARTAARRPRQYAAVPRGVLVRWAGLPGRRAALAAHASAGVGGLAALAQAQSL